MLIKTFSKKRFFTVFIAIVVFLSLIFPATAYGNHNSTRVKPSDKTNLLYLVGLACHNLDSFEDNIDIGNYSKSCGAMEDNLQDNLGCGNLFFEREFRTDPIDNSVTKTKWFTKQSAYKACYNQALKKYNFIAKNNSVCKKMRKGSGNWDSCENAQNALNGAIGCDSGLFRDLGDGYWGIKRNALNNCKNKINKTGNLSIVVVGSDGNRKRSDPIKSDSVRANPGGGAGASDDADSINDIDCQGGFGLGWIICPIFELGANMTQDVFDNLIKPMMTNVPVRASGGFYNAWQGFRILANIILIVALLFMVLAQAVGRSNVVDAYMVRKMAPRILIGVIGINLSIYLCIAAIDITNIIGGGLMQLITTPFSVSDLSPDTGASNVGGVLAILGALISGSVVLLGAGGAGGILGLMLIIILTIMLIVLAIMITLALRQSLLVLLTILSPVALALFILPSTEKYFRQWWDLFLKALIIYPIIAALFAVSGVLATINFESTNIGSTNLQGAFNIILGLILIFVPLFMIPFAFRMAGGVLGQFMNAANGMRSNFTKWNQQRLDRAGQNPDSRLSKGNRAIRQRASNAQFGAREALARRSLSSTKRAERLNKLAGLREGKNAAFAAEAAQGTYAKATSQIDEAQLDMARYGSSTESLAAIRNGQHISMSSAGVNDAAKERFGGRSFNELSNEEKKDLMDSGDQRVLSRQNQLRMYSAMNEKVGRGTAQRAAAAKSGAALAYGYDEGEEGWNQAVDIANDIFGGNESQMLSHMNEFQYVASQAGRSDLSGNVNSLEYNPLRSGGKSSGAAAMSQEKPQSVRSRINEQLNVLNNRDHQGNHREYSYKQKKQAVERLADLRAGGNSPYATNANKDVLQENSQNIDQAVGGFFNSSEMQQQAAAAEQSSDTGQYAENIFRNRSVSQGGTQTVRDASGAEVTVPITQEVSGADAAHQWFNQQSGRQLTQAEIEAQRGNQDQGNQGDQE